MSEAKGFIKQDFFVMMLVAGYFGITYYSIDEEYSSGFESIRDYFMGYKDFSSYS